MSKTNKYIIARDFWDEDGTRHPKGKYIELSADDAIDLVEAGSVMSEKAWAEHCEKANIRMEAQKSDDMPSAKPRKVA